MPLTVVQLVVLPGLHTVTEVKSPFATLAGPPLAVSVATFFAAPAIVLLPVGALFPLPPQPTHQRRKKNDIKKKDRDKLLSLFMVI
jgi:hypothetical protein